MMEPTENPASEGNPYQPPVETQLALAARGPEPVNLPIWYWPFVVGLFLVIVVVGATTYGIFWLMAGPILLGGIRTGWIMNACAHRGYHQPSGLGSLLMSFVLVSAFQVAASITYVIVCLTTMNAMNSVPSEGPIINFSIGIAVLTFFLLYAGSIWIGIASRRR
jgi:hypothetical protein